MGGSRLAAALALALTLVPAAALGQPPLALPVRCEIGPACIVQNHVDHAAGPSARDYRCGFLTYDGHKGTDLRVIDATLLAHGVPVLAAAPGRVRAVRDGMPDVSVRVRGKAAIAGREAGNSVVIEHGEGWETQYAHLRQGSVTVRAGDVVDAGRQLGVVGLSGLTEFPHLHFEVRHRGRVVDPFVGLEAGEACGPGDRPLWGDDAMKALTYVATGVLGAGISGAPPVLSDAAVDRQRMPPFTAASRALVFWVQIYGARTEDVEDFRLVGPDGRVLATRRGTLARQRAQWLAYVGVRGDRWAPGRYRGEYALYRGDPPQKVLSLVREIAIAPDAPAR